jgi:hypothetical protein
MMKKTKLIGVMFVAATITCSAQSFKSLGKDLKEKVSETTSSSSLSQDEVGKALKEALNIGVEKGVEQLSKADGYFKDPEIKIPLPDEAQEVESKLRKMGQGDKVDEAIESLNRAAEDAANGAKDIFIAAIKNMSIEDAITILNGEDDAATSYLDNSTREALTTKFKPIIKTSLEKVDATKHWNTVFSTYNKLPLVTKVNPDLEDYVTTKAIDGLFVQIAKEELSIRENPTARVTSLLKKVFGN